jgi:hypothetical protein
MGFTSKALRRLGRFVSKDKEICSTNWAAPYLYRRYSERGEVIDLTLVGLLLEMERDLNNPESE